MKKRKMKQKGFTLIEVLIVIVILAVLAALVLPRMIAQPERALTAEAFNYLGVIRRAQENMSAPNNAYVTVLSAGAGGGAGDPGWVSLGLGPLPASTSFQYACTTGPLDTARAVGSAVGTAGTCTATRLNVNPVGNARAGGTITIDLSDGLLITCGAPYTGTPAAKTVGAVCR